LDRRLADILTVDLDARTRRGRVHCHVIRHRVMGAGFGSRGQ
jgi:hypothetical protein